MRRFSLLAVLLLVLSVAAPALAQTTRYNGDETVADFRAWPEHIQIVYVLGWRAHSEVLSIRCVRSVTNGEYAAALRYDSRLSPTDKITRAMLALEIRDGCKVERQP